MTYTATLFLVLFAFIAVISAALKPLPRAREWLLIGFSVFIIASMGIFDAALFLSIAVANFFAARAVARLEGAARRGLLIATIACDIGALALFKYYNFIGGNFTAATGWPTPQLALGIPLAISFLIPFTSSATWSTCPGKSFRRQLSALPVLSQLFPHVVAGPIVRAWQLVPQLLATRRVRTDLAIGVHFLVTGLFLKSVLADNIGASDRPVLAGRGGLELGRTLAAGPALLLPIYGEFAGYSLMALGMARLLGYRLPANFAVRCWRRACRSSGAAGT